SPPAEHVEARHSTAGPGYAHCAALLPSHAPPQAVRSEAHACREPWGAPATLAQVPTWPGTSHAWHCPPQAALQQTPSTHCPLAPWFAPAHRPPFAAAGAAVRGACLSRSAGRADHVRARAGRAGDVAGLALSAAGGRAAHSVDALAARALVYPAAGDAGSGLRRADARRAVVPRHAVGVDRAVAGARRGTASERSARDVLLGGARARPVAGRSQDRHARAA